MILSASYKLGPIGQIMLPFVVISFSSLSTCCLHSSKVLHSYGKVIPGHVKVEQLSLTSPLNSSSLGLIQVVPLGRAAIGDLMKENKCFEC